MDRLLKYGLRDGTLKQISEVANGLACNCICANCKSPLVAKNNPENKKIPHFAHHSGSDCAGAYETTLHLLAKEVFKKHKRLLLPDFHFDYDYYNPKSFFRAGKFIKFETVTLEQSICSSSITVKPDAIASYQERELFIEFANTHFVDNEKHGKIIELGVACVEIDLSNSVMNESSILELLNSNTVSKYWIYNPIGEKQFQIHLQNEKLKAEKKVIAQQNELIEQQNRYSEFLADKTVRILKVKDGKANCPKKKIALSEFKKTTFYRHPILKRIIDGEYWNGRTYGFPPNPCRFYFSGEEIIVFPSANTEVSLLQMKEARFLYAGLKEIGRAITNDDLGDCPICEFSKGGISVGEVKYSICGHVDRE